MKNMCRLWVVIVICFFMVTGGFVGGYLFSSHSLGFSKYPASQFAIQTIQNFFVDPLVDETLAKGIVYGTGDPYSTYFTKEEYTDFSNQIADHYVGIGIIISHDLKINRVFPNSPAQEAGVKQGDFIIRVNQEDMSGRDSGYVADRIRGPEGTYLDIVFQFPKEEVRSYHMERRQVKIQTVESRMLSQNTAYIQIHSFNFGTADEFEKSFQSLLREKPSYLILDLRDNGGGVLEETQRIASYFLPHDSILFWTIGRNQKAQATEMKTTSLIQIPFVILVNRYSASASEVLSGAVQDYKTGTLIGEKTYGKASIQRILQCIPTGGAIKLTIEKYLTPHKRNIMGEGVIPDVSYENPVLIDNGTEDPVIEFAQQYLLHKG